MMAEKQSTSMLQLITRMVDDPRLRTLSDAELLGRFLEKKDEAAFRCLVRRHGSMVLDVCRSVLRNAADAEDAFQATFMVLVSKGRSVRKAASVGSWLHGVAYRTACKARRRSAIRRRCESQVTVPEATEPGDLTWVEVRTLVHEELSGLAECYRAPLVLCYLEGKTHAEAATQLGLPLGTLKGRLERARVILRSRLIRRGLGPTAFLVAAAWPASAASASVPKLLSAYTVKAAGAFVADHAATALRPELVALTREVLKAMLHTRLKAVALAMFLTALFGGAAVLATFPLLADPPRESQSAERPAVPDEGAKARSEPKPVVVHEDAVVYRLAWSGDGKTLVTIGVTYDIVALEYGKDEEGKVVVKQGTLLPNSTLKLRDAKTGALKHSFDEEKYTYFTGLAFSPDGKTAAVAVMKHPHDPPRSGGLSKTEVRLFDAETWALKDKADLAAPAYALAFSPDGTRLAVGNARRAGKGRDAFYMKLWDVREGKLASATKGGKAATAEDEKKIAALIAQLDNDGADVREKATKELADLGRAAEEAVRQALAKGPSPESRVRQEKVLEMLGRGGLPVNRLAFSPDGKLLVSGNFGDDDGKVCLFDGLSGAAIRVLDGHSKCVSGVAFSPDGKTLLSGSFDQTVKVWDVGSWKLQRTLGGQEGPVTALAFSLDGRLLATAAGRNAFPHEPPGGGNIKVLLWDTKTWESTRVFPDQTAEVDSLAFSPDGSVLALGGGNRTGAGGPDTPAEGRCKTPGEFKLLWVK